jgi:hypothetical protein
MALSTRGSFLEFLSNVIIVDDAIYAQKESKKRKVVTGPSGSALPKYQMVYHPCPTYKPSQHQHQRLHQQVAPKALPPPQPVLCLPAPPTVGATSGNVCFKCGHAGHFARECTDLKKNTTQGHVNYPPHGQQKVAIAKTGHIKYTTMEDVPEGEQVLVGMFSLNGYSIVILFDSGASHNFIIKACTKRCQLIVTHLSTPYMISTPGGKMTKYPAKNTPLNLAGKVYKTGLIMLDGQGIDMILGMRWMKEIKALLYNAAHTVQLESPAHGIVVLQHPSPIITALALHRTTAHNLEDIHVAREFRCIPE